MPAEPSSGRKFPLIALIVFLVFAASYFIWRSLEPPPIPTTPIPPPPPAFLNARWGMSPAEVEAANGGALQEAGSHKRYFTPKESVDKGRYKALQDPTQLVLGRPAEVTYVFFDDKLFSYHVFIQERDPFQVDQDMREFLVQKFGADYSAVDDESPLKMVWHTKDIFVNYWLLQNTTGLSDKYDIGYGVVYRPIEDAIHG